MPDTTESKGAGEHKTATVRIHKDHLSIDTGSPFDGISPESRYRLADSPSFRNGSRTGSDANVLMRSHSGDLKHMDSSTHSPMHSPRAQEAFEHQRNLQSARLGDVAARKQAALGEEVEVQLTNWEKCQHWLYTIIFEADTPGGKGFDIMLLVFITLSVLLVVLESIVQLNEAVPWLFLYSEYFFTGFFTIEYVLRIVCIGQPLHYVFSFFGVIDLVSIIPTYLVLTLGETSLRALRVIRVFRLLRVFNVLHLGGYYMEVNYLLDMFGKSRRRIIVFLSGVIAIVLCIGAMMYLVESEDSGFTSIPTSVYWAIVTVTTVGYGDLAPTSILGRMFASWLMISSFAVLTVPAATATDSINDFRADLANAGLVDLPDAVRSEEKEGKPFFNALTKIKQLGKQQHWDRRLQDRLQGKSKSNLFLDVAAAAVAHSPDNHKNMDSLMETLSLDAASNKHREAKVSGDRKFKRAMSSITASAIRKNITTPGLTITPGDAPNLLSVKMCHAENCIGGTKFHDTDARFCKFCGKELLVDAYHVTHVN